MRTIIVPVIETEIQCEEGEVIRRAPPFEPPSKEKYSNREPHSHILVFPGEIPPSLGRGTKRSRDEVLPPDTLFTNLSSSCSRA